MESSTRPMFDASDSEIEVQLWFRDLAPYGITDKQTSLYRRLQRLDDQDRIATLTVDVWGKQAPPPSKAAEETPPKISEALREFQQWADEHDRSLEPAFRRRSIASPLVGSTRETIVLPIVAVALYDGEELAAIYPHTESGEEGAVHTVDDCLETLELQTLPNTTHDTPGEPGDLPAEPVRSIGEGTDAPVQPDSPEVD